MNPGERNIIFYGNYFPVFYATQPLSVRKKIQFVFQILKQAAQIPVKFLKHLEGTKGLYEIRISANGNIYRLFCCFDEGNLIVLFNAFMKKSFKTPPDEIAKAIRLMQEYQESKKPKK